MTNSKIEIVKAYLEAATRQDFLAMQSYFTDDFVYHVPGKGPLSGVFVGKTAAIDYVGRMMSLTGGTYTITECVDWLQSPERVALIAKEQIVRLGETFKWTRVILFSFRGHRFSAVSLFDDNVDGLDALLAK
jgi:uncharacterized protein